jgi:hypothetical protein
VTDGTWRLAGFANEGGAFRYRDIRVLDQLEFDRVSLARQRLASVSGHVLTGPLTSSLNAFLACVQDIHERQAGWIRSPELRADLNSKLGAWLAAFTSFRAALEGNVERFGIPIGSAVPENFERTYARHLEYRLTWQLRNLDQHQPPAGRELKVSAWLDPDTDERLSAVMVRPVDLCQAQIDLGGRTRQWIECRDLWKGKPAEVDVRAVFKAAYDACAIVAAAYIAEREYQLIEDVAVLARLHNEASGVGEPTIYRAVSSEDGTTRNFSQITIDPLIWGEAMVTINGARRVLGSEEVDWATDPRLV